MNKHKEIIETLIQKQFVALYFSSPACNVCQVLKPKLFPAIKDAYPLFTVEDIDGTMYPEILSAFNVFSAPTLIIFIEGKESFRKTRVMGIAEILDSIKRPYDMLTV